MLEECTQQSPKVFENCQYIQIHAEANCHPDDCWQGGRTVEELPLSEYQLVPVFFSGLSSGFRGELLWRDLVGWVIALQLPCKILSSAGLSPAPQHNDASSQLALARLHQGSPGSSRTATASVRGWTDEKPHVALLHLYRRYAGYQGRVMSPVRVLVLVQDPCPLLFMEASKHGPAAGALTLFFLCLGGPPSLQTFAMMDLQGFHSNQATSPNRNHKSLSEVHGVA